METSENGRTVQTVIVNQQRSNGVGTAGFVLALLSLCLGWVPAVGQILWFLGLILSFCGMFKSPRGLAIAGFLISIIDFIVYGAIIAGILAVLSS